MKHNEKWEARGPCPMAVRRLPQYLNHQFRMPVTPLHLATRIVMSASSSSSRENSSYTTLRNRSICEQKIKQSKFIAIAGPISDEQSAHSFLSQVSLYPSLISFIIFNQFTTNFNLIRAFVLGTRPACHAQLLGLQGNEYLLLILILSWFFLGLFEFEFFFFWVYVNWGG